MIDTSENLIIIKGQIKTAEIESCQNNNGNYSIIFRNSSSVYSYKEENVIWLTHPDKPDPANYQIATQRRILSNIETLSIFKSDSESYWHIRFQNGKEYDYKGKDLQITRSCLAETSSKDIFGYLKKVAEVNELKADDGTKLLAKQYEKINFIADNRAIAVYLNPQKYKLQTQSTPTLIFPFGCNASQQKAVQTAFENQISVVQGPPGTGKTQTILNIIANILVRGKTVQVVSNNNSAIVNVLEKLSKYDMGFIVALLGSTANKEKFIETQEEEKQYPENFESWHDAETEQPLFLDKIHHQTEELKSIFSKQERLAMARQEIQALKIEWQHYLQEFGTKESTTKLRRNSNSAALLNLWNECQQFAEKEQTSNLRGITAFIQRLKWLFFRFKSKTICKIPDKNFYKREMSSIIADFQILFYQTKHSELEVEIDTLEKELANKDASEMAKQMADASMKYLKNKLFRTYGNNHDKPVFTLEDLKDNWREVQKEYPIILSTTFSSVSSLHRDTVYDYLIMDEASQVSVETGALALSCAKNAIIVGDTMQLPNVVTEEDKEKLDFIANACLIKAEYDCARMSFLQSVCKVIPNVPQTLLREHYRCHPKIINFCNQKFYGGNLVIMTCDKGEKDVIRAIRTAKGNHSRSHLNQREIDVIKEEVLPALSYDTDEIGVIAPYNKQVNAVKSVLEESIDVATVHKFQGREKDAIIMTTVDDTITAFSDDPNLLNVAVSRAKQQFYLVVSGNEQPKDCNISDLIAYIEYNNGTVIASKIHSIFDYLYEQYTDARIAYLKKHKKISEYDSENLTFALIEDILQENIHMCHLNIICHLPLYMLIQDYSLLNAEESKYAANINTHIDFLIYNRVSKQPILAIETDGYMYHKSGTRQAERDVKKDHILELYGIPLVRLSTIGSNEKKVVVDKLSEVLHLQ
ncbi:AAA domain-containing protein [Bacteroides acidifaciens]|uniref:AAA domain-containing protein n=1 Tax=Bacteroides acidifaciens TaxID=85831 RepID=UPI0015898D47|nr:AAA domain-containing protein [Bacteroides acidifaciens]